MSDDHQARTILVPLDLTGIGESKIPVAEEYARALGADVLGWDSECRGTRGAGSRGPAGVDWVASI